MYTSVCHKRKTIQYFYISNISCNLIKLGLRILVDIDRILVEIDRNRILVGIGRIRILVEIDRIRILVENDRIRIRPSRKIDIMKFTLQIFSLII